MATNAARRARGAGPGAGEGTGSFGKVTWIRRTGTKRPGGCITGGSWRFWIWVLEDRKVVVGTFDSNSWEQVDVDSVKDLDSLGSGLGEGVGKR